mgnify:CR=1 FL=1
MAKIALGTWAWGAGAFGGDAVFGSKTDVENLKPVFDAAMKNGLNLWDTATVYGMGESEKILGSSRLKSLFVQNSNMYFSPFFALGVRNQLLRGKSMTVPSGYLSVCHIDGVLILKQ